MNGSAPTALRSPLVTLALAAVLLALATAALVPSLLSTPGSSPIAAASPSGRASPSPTPTPGLTLAYPTPSPEPTFLSYTVRVGDTLSSIARTYSTTARSLSWWNRGTYPSLDPESSGYDPNSIKPGWSLVLLPGTTVDENNPPSPSPAPPTVAPTGATPLPSLGPPVRPTVAPSIAPSATVISHGSRTSNRIALTFDMGGRLDPAVQIVQWLIDHHVHATVFPTGKAGSTTSEGQAALALVKAHPELFDVGNHSWDHPDFTTLTAAQMASQITRTESAIAPLTGQTTKPWFRPPFGAYSAAVRAGVGAAGWRYLVMWDVDTIDWKPESQGGPSAAQIVAKIQANAQSGSIVLMHLGGYHTLEALPGILAAVESKGLQPATLGELLGS
ncbi:MAG TPA: polysaccharide deacetylase family protein [Candidatus Limnocylindrales bacterium]|nr:polysaccharide deacetylase family protein [Candidatus Limnocylindrales bacterium]